MGECCAETQEFWGDVFFLLRVSFCEHYGIVGTQKDIFLYFGSLGVFSLPGVLILHLKWDLRLMSHKWLVLRRIWLFNAAELSYDRNKQDDYIARDYFLLIYCDVGHYLLNRPLCAFHMHLLFGHREQIIYSFWNRAVATTIASWLLTWHFSNNCVNFPAQFLFYFCFIKLWVCVSELYTL